jgi:hypothetical protein
LALKNGLNDVDTEMEDTLGTNSMVGSLVLENPAKKKDDAVFVNENVSYDQDQSEIKTMNHIDSSDSVKNNINTVEINDDIENSPSWNKINSCYQDILNVNKGFEILPTQGINAPNLQFININPNKNSVIDQERNATSRTNSENNMERCESICLVVLLCFYSFLLRFKFFK